jgi:hypothetical protein
MELIVKLFFGLLAKLFSKFYRRRHPELLGKPAEELAFSYAKLQLIHIPKGWRLIILSPLLLAIIIVAGVISKGEVIVILIGFGALVVGSFVSLVPWLKFAAIVEPSQSAMEDYFSENKAAVIDSVLKDPEVISAHKRIGKFYINRALKNIRTELYPGF